MPLNQESQSANTDAATSSMRDLSLESPESPELSMREQIRAWLTGNVGNAWQQIYQGYRAAGDRADPSMLSLSWAIASIFKDAKDQKSIKPVEDQELRQLAASEEDPLEFLVKALVRSTTLPGLAPGKHALNAEFNVTQAFHSEYHGTTEFLQLHIDSMLRVPNRYSNAFSIIQSSGTGKSRLVDELAKTYFTFPICVRADDEEASFSYPPSDVSIREFFLRCPETHSRLASLCFLWALFSHGKEAIGSSTPGEWREKLTTLTPKGKNYRREFYTTIVKLALDKLVDHEYDFVGLYIAVVTKFELLREALSVRLSGNYKQVAKPAIVVYIDEADTIEASLPALTSTFQDMREQNIVGIYISTKSLMDGLVPPLTRVVAKTERATASNVANPPVTELSLDVWADQRLPSDPKKACLKDIRAIEAAASLGRPLYLLSHPDSRDCLNILRWTAQLENEYEVSRLLRLAETKLARQNLDGSVPLSENAKFAMLLCRLAVTNRPSSRHFAQDLVASHLAIAYFVNRRRKEIQIGYPPEPLVSAAAARYMTAKYHEVDPKKREDWVDWLHQMISMNLVSRGDRGELLSRVVLTLARDKAYKAPSKDDQDNQETLSDMRPVVPGHEPVSLKEFLRCLIGPTRWEKARNAKPFNLPVESSQTLENFIGERSVIDFTCFTRDKDCGIFTYRGMITALYQGAAVMCNVNQEQYDHAIVWVIDAAKPLTKENVGIILEQAKITQEAVGLHYPNPCKFEGLRKIPIISIGHRHAQLLRLDIPKGNELTIERSTEDETPQPRYHITLDGSELLPREKLLALLDADDPLKSYREGGSENIREAGKRIILEKNRLYGVRTSGPLSCMTLAPQAFEAAEDV